jgi:hypothetical protein
MTQTQYTWWWLDRHSLDIAGDISIVIGLLLGIVIHPALILPFVVTGFGLKLADSFINHDTAELVSILFEEVYHLIDEIVVGAILSSLTITVAAAILLRYGVLGVLTGGVEAAASIIATGTGAGLAILSTYLLYEHDYQQYENSHN